MGILAAIANGLRAIAEVFGWAKQRDGEKNAPDIKAAAEAKQLQSQEDAITKHVAEGDLDAIRKDDAAK